MGGKLKNPKEYHKHWRETHKEQVKQAHKKWQQSEKGKATCVRLARGWRQKHPERSRQIKLEGYYRHREENLLRMREWGQKVKKEVLTHYGNDKCACVICRESRLACLSIDHIDKNGYEHRKKVGAGSRLYRWLIKNNYPEGFQTLCMNCQFIKRKEAKECSGPRHSHMGSLPVVGLRE